jgi:hypothetical protein
MARCTLAISSLTAKLTTGALACHPTGDQHMNLFAPERFYRLISGKNREQLLRLNSDEPRNTRNVSVVKAV